MNGRLTVLPVGTLEVFPLEASRAIFGAQRVARYGVQAYGSCFFHSVLAAVNVEVRGTPFRDLPIGEQREVADAFRCEFGERRFRALLERFCEPKVWADQELITRVSAELDANILFVDGTRATFYCGVAGKDPATMPAIAILWVNHVHFEPILFVDAVEERRHVAVRGVLRPTKSEADAKLVQSIMRRYAQMCAPPQDDTPE